MFYIVPREEFIRYEKESCSKRNVNVLKEFVYPTKFLPNTETALSECEIYCGSKEKCWGCVRHCQAHCQWNAISDCGKEEKLPGLVDSGISQKPGRNTFF